MERFTKTTLVGAVALIAFIALPACAETVDLNPPGGVAGSYTTSGGTFYIDQLEVGSTTINISTSGGCNECLVLNYTLGATPTLTLTNGSSDDATLFPSLADGATLYSATSGTGLSITVTNDTTGSGGELNLTVADNTPIALDSTLFNYLISDSLISPLTVNAFTLSGGISGGYEMGTNVIYSDTLALSAPVVPEPSSLLLLASGMVAAAGAVRKRLIVN